MGIYMNPDDTLFRNDMLYSEIYVDKSLIIKEINTRLFGQSKYMCVSRPRRFGKSMTLNMICAYYSRGCDSEKLFEKLNISKADSFQQYRNRFNVIALNMRDILDKADTIKGMIGELTKEIVFDILGECPDVRLYNENDLIRTISDCYMQTKIPFIFLFDEWDAIFRVYQEDKEAQKAYLDFIRNLLKDKPYVALAYMTGILPIKKYGEQSALNMFTEYSMSNQRELAEFTGFTVQEVKDLCRKYDMSYEETKRWYDGYNVRGLDIYNPRSVVMSMTGRDYDNYWTQTETYKALKVYIQMDYDGLKSKIIRLIAGEKVPINTLKFSNDMTTFNSSDDVLTLLVHLGYLTFDFENKTCNIPNAEVQQEFINSIEDGGWEEVMKSIRESDKLLEATLKGKEKYVADQMEMIHQNETSILAYNDENALASVLSLAYYSARKDYDIIREMPAGKGYADLVFIPRWHTAVPAMIVELKVDKTADSAIDQIKNKRYIDGLKSYRGKVLLVGIQYDKGSKTHRCKIEQMKI